MAEALIHPCQAQSTGEEADVVAPVYMAEAERGVSEALSSGESFESLFGGEFGFGNLEPGFEGSGLGAATRGDDGGGWGFVHHARAEFDQGGFETLLGAVFGEVDAQLRIAEIIDGRVLRITCLAAAVEDVVVVFCFRGCEDPIE